MSKLSLLPMRIINIEIKKETKKVYNFTVEKDESYIANGVVSHNCRCQLVPKIKDEWAQKELSKNGIEWGPDQGLKFTPTEKQRKLGFDDMTWDEWLRINTGD